MDLKRVILVFGLLSLVLHGISETLAHPGGYHMAVHDPRVAWSMRLLTAGVYLAAGFAAGRRQAYAGLVAGVAVASIGRILGQALSYLLVPGASGMLIDFGFWRFSLDISFVLEVAFGGVCGGIGTALSRLPFLSGRDRMKAG